MKTQLVASLLISVLSDLALANVTVISRRGIDLPVCEGRPNCQLSQVRFEELKKTFRFSGDPEHSAHWLTDTRFRYQVPSPAQIEDHAIVQWIRGCVFHSETTSSGAVKKTLSVSRNHFGKIVTFRHPTFEVDTDNADPVYSADADYGRFALLRWNQSPLSMNPDTATWYANRRPPHGTVFLTDLPASTFLIRGTPKAGSAQNATLEFQTCLFNSSDVPTTVSSVEGLEIDKSKALACVTWDHKYSWDFKSGKMTSPRSIDPVCEVREF